MTKTPSSSISVSLFAQAKEVMNESAEKGLGLIHQAIEQAQQINDLELEFDITLFLSKTYRIQGEAFPCLENLNKGYRILNRNFPKDHIRLSLIYKEYGSVYADCLNNNTTALDYSLKSLSLNNPELIGTLHNNIGCMYTNLGQYDKATTYLSKGEKFCIHKKDFITLSFLYENFGEIYRLQRNFSAAISSYNAGIKSSKEAYQHSNDHQSISYIYSYNLIGLSRVYLANNQLDLIPDLLQEICDLSKKHKLHSCWSEAAIIKGELLLKNKQEDLYRELFDRATQFCTTHALHADKETWLNNMIVLCEDKSNYKEALKFSKMLIENKKDQETKTKAINISKILENKEVEILALENKNREIQLQQYQLEQFSYIVAHDLKTPLSNISNFIGLFSRKYRDQVDDENKYFLDLILNNSNRLHLMLDELLLYITVNNIKGDIPWTNVESILSKIQKKRQAKFITKKGQLSFDPLPKVKIHPSHLEIVLDHMIKNSLKFSKKDQEAKIKIEVQEDENEYRFFVIDNGIGIKKEYQQQIFDLFKQLDKINYTGIGMGLAICKKIITIYGGDIKVSNNDWKGTTFEFNIPKKDKLT